MGLGLSERAKKFGWVVICKPVFRSLGWDVPIVRDQDLIAVFEKVPGTENPGKHPIAILNRLSSQLKLDEVEKRREPSKQVTVHSFDCAIIPSTHRFKKDLRFRRRSLAAPTRP